MREQLLGFDVRQSIAPAAAAVLWPSERRALFLLRADVAQPLSVDVLVWPSVFDTGQGIGMSPSERRLLGLAGIPAPSYTGPNDGLWEDLSAMLRCFEASRPAPTPAALVAVTLVTAGSPPAAGPSPIPPPTVPEPAWQRLGCDVADSWRVSGLSNCGYGAEEAETLRPQWTPFLNEGGLFDDPRMADAFRLLSDRRVPEHAPFFVYGLYLVGELPA